MIRLFLFFPPPLLPFAFMNAGIIKALSYLQGKLYMIMEICRSFDQTFKDHLDGMYVLFSPCYLVYILNHM